MKTLLFVLFYASLGILAAACSSGSSDSSSTSSSSSLSSASPANMSQSDAVVMMSSSASSIEADVHNFVNPGQFLGGPIGSFGGGSAMPFLFPGLGVGFNFGFGEEALMFAPASSCVAVDVVSNTAADKDVIYTFSCPNLSGTYEIKSMNGASGNSWEAISKLVFSAPAIGYSNSINDDYSISKSASAVITISKQFDDLIKNSSDSYEKKGNYQIVIDPVIAMNTSANASVQISGNFDQLKNGADQGSVVVSSSGLERGSCGFDAGSIEFKTASDDYVVSFVACGKVSVTDNGQPVSP